MVNLHRKGEVITELFEVPESRVRRTQITTFRKSIRDQRFHNPGRCRRLLRVQEARQWNRRRCQRRDAEHAACGLA
jgi:hypothetical protein